MATKKFVKSDMFTSNKYTEKTEKPPDKPDKPEKEKQWNNNQQRPRKQREYVERGDTGDLRKFFEFVPVSAVPEIQKLISKFPIFFCEQSQGWESGHNKFHGRQDRVANVVPEPEVQQICSWDSEGEIDLGVGILNKASLKKYEGAAPLKVDELKRHEREFLEEVIRKKAQDEEKTKREAPKKYVELKKEENKVEEKKQAPIRRTKKSSCSQNSDDEIQIVKTTNYQVRVQQTPAYVHKTPSKSESILSDQSGEDDRFKSDSSKSDDIFGDNSDKEDQEQEVPEVTTPKETGLGSVQFAKGQFGIFAFGEGVKPDDEAWTISDGATVFKKLSSAEMDRDYLNVYSQFYHLINFNNYPSYVEYSTFLQNRSIDLFLAHKQQGMNNYQNKFDQQSKKKRKYSTAQQYQQEDNNKQRNRRQSALYKPKKTDNDSL